MAPPPPLLPLPPSHGRMDVVSARPPGSAPPVVQDPRFAHAAALSLDDIPTHFPEVDQLPRVDYLVSVSTASVKGACTDKPVFIQLIGDLNTTAFIQLRHGSRPMPAPTTPPLDARNNYSTPSSPLASSAIAAAAASDRAVQFPIASVREFSFRAHDVGNLVRIVIHHDPDADPAGAWKPDRFLVQNRILHRGWSFLCPRWLTRKHGNVLELISSGDLAVGQRACRRAARRLVEGKPHRFAIAASPSASTSHFQSMRERFSNESPENSASNLGHESGTKRVFFQLQKFTQTASHVYLIGSIPALGEWRPERGCRMTQHSASDGTWRGEWRLEMEIDDDFDEIQYTYMIVNESDPSDQRRVALPDTIRSLKLNSPDLLDRPVEGGRIHVKDMFGNNKFGLPLASTPASISRARSQTLNTPMGPATWQSGSLPLNRDILRRTSSKVEEVQRNLNLALESSDEPLSSDTSTTSGAASVTQASGNVAVVDVSTAHDDSSGSGCETEEMKKDDDDDSETERIERNVSMERKEERSLREWKMQLDASDQHVFLTSDTLRRHQSEVSFLKQRNSGEYSVSSLNHSPPPKSPEESSPVSSDDHEELEDEIDAKIDVPIVADLSGELEEMREERDALAAKFKELEEQQKKKAGMYKALTVANLSLREELLGVRAEVKEHQKRFAAQAAELGRLLHRGGEEHRAIISRMEANYECLQERWGVEFKERRKLFNTVQELRGNIRVFCRVRPLKYKRTSNGNDAMSSFDYPDAGTGENARIHIGGKTFEFDYIFQPQCTQGQVYRETAGVVGSVLDGYNVCVFAYGQTGSGKTFTMNGPEEDRGVNFRALEDLFKITQRRSEHSEVSITVSIMEIYNEVLRDLIRPDGSGEAPKLEIRKDPNSSSPTAVYVPNLTEVEVDSFQSIWNVMEEGSKNRAKGKTNMNEHSSRSHLVLRVTVKCRQLSSGVKSSGVLHLVDLAGSERIARSNASGDRLKEAQHINKSLASLGDVFTALTTKSSHVPYRNSRLTYLLQDCLGGDSKTLMFVNVSPDVVDSSESTSSLLFAQRVARVELGGAHRHVERASEAKAVAALQVKESEVGELQTKLISLQKEVKKKDDVVSEMKQRNRSMEHELSAVKNNLEDQSKRESADHRGMARELKELRAQNERAQTELRSVSYRFKDMTSKKDEEIRSLQAQVKEGDGAARRESASRFLSAAAQRIERFGSAPDVSGKRPDRLPQTKLPPRSATNLPSRSRQVRFDDSETKAGLAEKKPNDDSISSTNSLASSKPPSSISGVMRRPAEAPASVSRLQRPTRPAVRPGSVPIPRKPAYAFGSRTDSAATTETAGSKAVRPSKLPRAQTSFLRPPQRPQPPLAASAQNRATRASSALPATSRSTPTVRRGATMGNVSNSSISSAVSNGVVSNK